jgi:protein O-GlcNAc transferase
MNRHERRREATREARRARQRGGAAPVRTGALLISAQIHHDAGRLPEAEALYQQLLALDPEHPDALHRLGVLAHQTGQHDVAAEFIERAIAVKGDAATFHANLGWVLHAGGRLPDAERALRRALALDPTAPQARNNLGIVLQAQGRLREAEASFRATVASAPRFADAHSNLGRALHAQGRFEEAVTSYGEALALTPDVADIHNNLGVALKTLGRTGEAIEAYERALAIDPGHVTAHLNLGLAYRADGQLVDAMGSFVRAVTLAPGCVEAYANLGLVLLEMGHVDDAVTINRRAVAMQPDDAGVHTNLGLALQAQGRVPDAIASYRRAIGMAPRMAEAHNNLGTALEALGRIDDAVATYEQAIARGLDRAEAHANLGRTLLGQNRIDDGVAAYRRARGLVPDATWDLAIATALPVIPASSDAITAARARLEEDLDALLASDPRVGDPDKPTLGPNFYLAYHGLDDRELQEKTAIACFRANRTLAWTAPHCLAPAPIEGRRLRVGFLSRYLGDHSIGRLTRGFIEQLSRERFEVVVLHARGGVDEMSAAIDRSADRALRLPGRLGPARDRIAAEALDVLVYPEIGMDPMTYLLAFARLAPVQCMTWGHPVTSGLPTIDYFLSSEDLEPDGAEAHYTERLHRLSRLPAYYHRPPAATTIPTRAALGLDDGATLYLCPQSLYKLHPDFDAILGEILHRDPKGQLVLIEGLSSHWSRDWRARFARACPDVSDRVRFVPRLTSDEFLGLLRVADALLDPLPFGGGTTSYSALGLGLPIVTWPGPQMRGRATYACYRQLGVGDCVAGSPEGYVELAVRLANDRAWRSDVGARIVAGQAGLFEDTAVVREIEEFFVRATAEALTAGARSVSAAVA